MEDGPDFLVQNSLAARVGTNRVSVIKTVGWEIDFVCEGVSSLMEFSYLFNEMESLYPVSCAVQFASGRDQRSAAQTFQKISVV